MNSSNKKRVAILYPGHREERQINTPSDRFRKVFEAFHFLGIDAEPVIYNDDFCDEVKQQISQMGAVLVWVNPIEGGRDRTKLDAMLLEVAKKGVFVSTHPEIILKLGTKEVLVHTKKMGWGSDVHLYKNLSQMRCELPLRLSRGEVRVLKQYRGHSGDGVWRVERASGESENSLVRVRHAKSGCIEEVITLEALFGRCASYFAALDGQGRMVDQIWQNRLSEGMVRCYLVHGKVEGFGRQEIVALHPTAQATTKRHYHPPTMPEFQRLKHLLESEWVPDLQKVLEIETADLPVLWDCDFMFGPKDSKGEDTYVLCEINVSSVSPFPDSAAEPLARAVMARLQC